MFKKYFLLHYQSLIVQVMITSILIFVLAFLFSKFSSLSFKEIALSIGVGSIIVFPISLIRDYVKWSRQID
ncbi:hypothetical protein GCM10022410_18320 [Amphibacillus indicireducens]|uniref:Uncharacterized protein n=1 Tax=Amphibacillus indicireducens TaxID=1076330 RepID=A0ABP7VRZ9_9BACI